MEMLIIIVISHAIWMAVFYEVGKQVQKNKSQGKKVRQKFSTNGTTVLEVRKGKKEDGVWNVYIHHNKFIRFFEVLPTKKIDHE